MLLYYCSVVHGLTPLLSGIGCILTYRRRRAPTLDESFVQGLLGAKSAMQRCLVCTVDRRIRSTWKRLDLASCRRFSLATSRDPSGPSTKSPFESPTMLLKNMYLSGKFWPSIPYLIYLNKFQIF